MDTREWCILNKHNYSVSVTHYRLHVHFQENSEESVRLSVVHSMMRDHFPGLSLIVTNLSRLVSDAFPGVSVKRLGKKSISSIELRQPPSPDFATDSASCSFSDAGTGTATPISSCVATQPSPSSLSKDTQTAHLLLELQMERDRRAALENEVDRRSEVRSADDFRQSLCAEIDTIVCSQEMLLHGHCRPFLTVISQIAPSCASLYSNLVAHRGILGMALVLMKS